MDNMDNMNKLLALQPSKGQLGKLSEPLEASASPPPTTAEMRGLAPDDPDAKKKQTRDWLLSRVQDLERDLQIAIAENERIRKATVSKSEVSPPLNKQEIIDLLRRHALPSKDKTNREPTAEPPAWLKAALDPISLLPFSIHVRQPSEDTWGIHCSNDPLVSEDTYPRPKPASHHPQPLSREVSQSYLQLFTPLHFSTLNYLLERKNPSDPVIMRHSTMVTAQRPLQGLFTAHITADVNTKTLAIVYLSVGPMDPAADSELTPFVTSICSLDNKPTSSALTNNLSILSWSMAEWLRVAVRRAKFWKILDEELSGSNKANLVNMVRSLRAGKGKRGSGKKPSLPRRRHQDDAEDSESDNDHEAGDATDDLLGNTKAWELSGYMGQTRMDYHIPFLGPFAVASGKGKQTSVSHISSLHGSDDYGSILRIQWRMEFDWTGEARSDIAVVAGVPGRWHQFDERGQLFGMSKLFDDLLQGGEDPLDAVRTVVSLLAGDPGLADEDA